MKQFHDHADQSRVLNTPPVRPSWKLLNAITEFLAGCLICAAMLAFAALLMWLASVGR